MYMILMCRSLTTAQKAARLIQNSGIFAVTTKAPQSANPNGCTYGVKITAQSLDAARSILDAAGIEVLKTVELPDFRAGGRR